jgi:hypothetical protein
VLVGVVAEFEESTFDLLGDAVLVVAGPAAGAGVAEFEDVAHADAAAGAVVLEGRVLVVEPDRPVPDAALDRHRDLAAVAGQPVAQGFGGFIRALEGRRDDVAGVGATSSGVFHGSHDRSGAHVGGAAQPRDQPLHPDGVLGGDLGHEAGEAVVAALGVFVVGGLGHHVGDGEGVQGRLGVLLEALAAFVGGGRACRGTGGAGRARLGTGSGELGHRRSFLAAALGLRGSGVVARTEARQASGSSALPLSYRPRERPTRNRTGDLWIRSSPPLRNATENQPTTRTRRDRHTFTRAAVTPRPELQARGPGLEPGLRPPQGSSPSLRSVVG